MLKKEVMRLHIINRVVSGPGPTPGNIKPVDQASMDRQAIQQSHENIYKAIEEGDATAAKSAMERHIQDIIDKNIRLMAQAEKVSLARELTEEELSYTA